MAGSEQRPAQSRQRRRTAKEHGPDPIDRSVGRQLRLARELASLTQVEIGRALGMSFQVVQKYEQGEIRVSASRLFQLARRLDMPVSYFFAASADGDNIVDTALARAEIELIRSFRAIGDTEVRQRLLLFVRSVAGQAADTERVNPAASDPMKSDAK